MQKKKRQRGTKDPPPRLGTQINELKNELK